LHTFGGSASKRGKTTSICSNQGWIHKIIINVNKCDQLSIPTFEQRSHCIRPYDNVYTPDLCITTCIGLSYHNNLIVRYCKNMEKGWWNYEREYSRIYQWVWEMVIKENFSIPLYETIMCFLIFMLKNYVILTY